MVAQDVRPGVGYRVGLSMKVEILRPELEEAYDQYVLGHRQSLLYYGVKYKNLLKALLGCDEEYLLAVEGGAIRGVLPLMYTSGSGGYVYNSLPYYGSNGGILADHPNAYRALADAYSAIARHDTTVSATLITNPLTSMSTEGIAHTHTDYRIGQVTNLVVEGEPWDSLTARVNSSARRNLRKALSEGLTVEADSTQFEPLRRIHQENIRSIGGLPKTDEFFALVPRYFTPGEDFEIYVAKKEGAVIAALLLFYFNRTVEYFTPATKVEYRPVQALPLIIMTAMAEASRRGFEWWNWGGTWTKQMGVYRFKKKWGAIDCHYNYFTQLNAPAILSQSAEQILNAFPNFFVVPFAALHQESTHE